MIFYINFNLYFQTAYEKHSILPIIFAYLQLFIFTIFFSR